jgi:hypothetical protein
MEEKTTVKMQCVFCFASDFEVPYKGYTPHSGEMIRCANCGRLNDYDSLVRIAKRKGKEWAEKQANEFIENGMKKIFRGFGR